MPKTRVILNPLAGRGYASTIAPKVRRTLASLGVSFDYVETEYAGHAVVLARQAVREGYETIVSVGGDGTAHEIINGIMQEADGTFTGTLGCIPAGSGNDFAVMNGVPTQVEAACTLIATGAPTPVDLGKITLDGTITRYFDNTVGVGFDGLVAKETRRLTHLRGLALYLPVVLKTIFITMQSPHVALAIDDRLFDMRTVMISTCNGPRQGGGFLMAPHARYDDGLLDVIVAETLPRLEMLALVPRFLKGTHLSHKKIATYQGRRILIASDDILHVHVDGEILAEEVHRVEIEVVPQCLRMIRPLQRGPQAGT